MPTFGRQLLAATGERSSPGEWAGPDAVEEGKVRKLARVQPDLEEYRQLLEVPSEFEDGFNLKLVFGAIFIGFVMMPGSIYLSLVAGQSIGPAAQWTTLILFTEIAKRSFAVIKKQEIFILFYMAGGLAAAGMVGAGPAGQMIWNQYLRQSPAAEGYGIANSIPTWVVPAADSSALAERTFFHHDWLIPIALMTAVTVISKLNWLGLGYGLFRVCSDVEKLPFPMAPVGALGTIALAESAGKEQTWRWRVFSVGAMIGLMYGVFYVGIPALSATCMSEPFKLIPIPWVDLTPSTEKLLPGAALGIQTDLGLVISGAVLPFYVVMGGSVAALLSIFVNPILVKQHVITTWRPGLNLVNTAFAAGVDFWISFSIGLGIALFLFSVLSIVRRASQERRRSGGIGWQALFKPPPGRGDLPIAAVFAMYLMGTLASVLLCHRLVPDFPWPYLVLYGFIVTPAESLISARMLGVVGQWVGIPMLREGTFILSGYRGVDIWFAPIPLSDMGGTAQYFRQVELTGTKIISIIKADLVMTPVILICGLLFWQFAWKLAPIPSSVYPYTEGQWPLGALHQTFWITATREGPSPFRDAFDWHKMVLGFGVGFGGLSMMSALALPITLMYGFIRGIGSLPHAVIPEMFGALLGRYYFERRLGRQTWRRYSVVLLAGYSCGMGLVGLSSASLAMITTSVSRLQY